ncbi:MAG: acylphosphatase [Candidatus Thermoplasmatota archaeon]|nr:acylphosphatase [Candidatus Thermoplasmatota archaeon]
MMRAHVRVFGRVQGVFFRQGTAGEASRLGLGGWVRNCDDGSVEALFEGESDAVEQMVAWCSHGPPSAEVEKVEVVKSKIKGAELRSFEIRG